MKKVTLFATIGVGLILLMQIIGFITNFSHIRYFGSPAQFVIFSIVRIIAWLLIGYFFLTLYRKQPK